MSRLPFALAVLALLAPAAPQAKDRGPKKFIASDEDFPNPERGMTVFINLIEKHDLAYLREKGITLVFANVSLVAYRNGPIAPEFLAKLGDGFQRARSAGAKIVLRFTYSGNIGEPDAPKAVVLRHIAQLKPLLQAHGDILAAFQAGFIGAWGEWHGSKHGNDAPEVRREVVQALLDAVPSSRMVQLRTPGFKQSLTGATPLAEAAAFRGTPRARLGHHNDALFADATDKGTYADPVKNAKEWVAQDARFVVNGGETAPEPKGSGAEFIAEMERLHWSYLHLRYGTDVLRAWEQQGHLGKIRRRLGYRLSLIEATFPAAVKPGGQLELTLRIRNEGFAAPYNRRPVHVVLSNKTTRYDATLSVDPRRWEPGEHKVTVRLSIPSKALRTPYRLSLALPDDAPALAGRPEYALRFANAGIWDPKEGTNILSEEVRISDNAPGLPTSGVKEFVEVR